MLIFWFFQLIFNSAFMIFVASLVRNSDSTKRGKKFFELILISGGIGYFLGASMLYY